MTMATQPMMDMDKEMWSGHGAVYFMTNAVDGKNEVVMVRRGMDGSLTLVGSYATGGSGAGKGPMEPFADPLASQGSIIMSTEHNLLFAVNAGSSEISVFRTRPDGLTLLNKVSSNGNFPVSLALHGNWLYVLNSGGDAMIAGYTVQPDSGGKLIPMMDATRSLGVGGTEPPDIFATPGQIQFRPDGRMLVVVEKGIDPKNHKNHKIHVFSVSADGLLSAKPVTTISNGHFPFSFEFDKAGHMLVVETFGSGPVEVGTGAVTSYSIDANGDLKVISGTVDTHQRETCWIATAEPYAYVTDFGSHVITGYRIGMDGSLSLLNQDGVTASTGDGTYPVDLAVTPDKRFLYVLLPGKSQVGTYRVNNDGSLTSLGAVSGMWPIGMQGLAVR